ncbi:MAG: hypothetical protein Q8O05_05375, partial [Chloroflexota bacterium]|nr:hypothetical protein [Chloroflexota bacterium]
YSSTQVKGEAKNNIVILPHAAMVEWPTDVPLSDSGNPHRLIWADGFCFITDAKPGDKPYFLTLDSETVFDDYNISTNPTLRIINESIRILEAKSIAYETKSYDIH